MKTNEALLIFAQVGCANPDFKLRFDYLSF